MRNPLFVLLVAIAAVGTRSVRCSTSSRARNGAAGALLKPVVAKLSEEDMLSISAYLTSLEA